jgi:hypothetical protein
MRKPETRNSKSKTTSAKQQENAPSKRLQSFVHFGDRKIVAAPALGLGLA